MNLDEAQTRMQEIQRIMERATLWTILPGTAAVIGGLMVFGGCLISYLMFGTIDKPNFSQIDFASLLDLSLNAQITFCVLWFLIGAGGVVVEIHTAQLQAKKQGISLRKAARHGWHSSRLRRVL